MERTFKCSNGCGNEVTVSDYQEADENEVICEPCEQAWSKENP